LSFQTHYQYFAPEDAANLADARDTNGLGFHDIRFASAPLPTLVTFLRGKMPEGLPKIVEAFNACKPILHAYSVARSIEYDELIRELEIFYPKDDEEEEDYFEGLDDYWA
jgi:hypothetical protein